MVTESDAHSRGDDGKAVLREFDDLYNHIDIKFVLYLDPEYYDDIKSNPAEFEKRFHLINVWRTSNMTCFNTSMAITNYKCVGDMMEEYYGVRLAKYAERKANEMARLEADAVEADAKARFLQGVLDGTIELRRATDEEIVSCLTAHDLPPLNDPKQPAAVDSYEYLLRIRIDRVKASAIEDAKRHQAEARAALARLRMMTPGQMWLRELEAFLVAWDEMRMTREKKLEQKVSVSGKAVKKGARGAKVTVKRVS
jgi:DNA topoisomerase-2